MARAIQQATYQAMLTDLAQVSYAPASQPSRRSWGNTFEDQTAQFCAENGISPNFW